MGEGSDPDRNGQQAECEGPHVVCQACGGQGQEYRATLYLPDIGAPESVPGGHRCWHCAGSGYYCRRRRGRCTPPHRG
ncbi:hypothetical protein [Streptomyces sp. YIM 98790]|uniref:hypothetical protein n=1 Tax=Streptomyces sp. YIM 98790 TaxID=2689077 RepID=UPI00140A72B5|nr:hypothetical protein [Streptomyces sp. YIM 98790]